MHRFYKELYKNEKWIQRITVTTPKRSGLSISLEEEDEVDEDDNNRPEGKKIAKKESTEKHSVALTKKNLWQ